jgi:hypothetical protein
LGFEHVITPVPPAGNDGFLDLLGEVASLTAAL